jgi:hypothetical protein
LLSFSFFIGFPTASRRAQSMLFASFHSPF